MSSINGKSHGLSVRIAPTTPEQQATARLACARNATDAAELVTFLSMLGIEVDE